jgi:hypothetical protein
MAAPVSAMKRVPWFEIIAVLFLFAVPNDLLDIFEITIVAKPVTMAIEIYTGIFLFLWFVFGVGESSGRILVRLIIVMFIEMIPGLGLLPVWTFIILNKKLGITSKILGLVKGLLPFV